MSDVLLAKNINAEGILVRTGEGVETEAQLDDGDVTAVFDTISGAVGYVVLMVGKEKRAK
jgi:ribonucleotide monophosphatase NagD (HAD superfamily)